MKREPAAVSLIVSQSDPDVTLSALVDRAAEGEEIVITRDGVPRAKIMPFLAPDRERAPAGALGVTYISDDFDAPDPAIDALFNGA
jgi:prevent-host-death family protein